MPDVLTLRSFAMIGVAETSHGCALVRHILSAGLRPRFALVATGNAEQLSRSRDDWDRADWWHRRPRRPWLAVLRRRRMLSDATLTHVEALYRLAGVPCLFVPALDGPVACRLLGAGGVDAAVLAEAPMLRGEVLSVLPAGLLNLHAAPLPEYRGNYSTYWALYHDEPLYVTAHVVAARADRGAILARRRLPVFKTDTLEDIDRRGFEECGLLAADVLARAGNEGVPVQPQADWQGTTFRGPMPPEIIDELRRRLRDQEYTHYA